MSKVKSRGEISPLTAAVVTLLILVVSGLSVWRYAIRDTSDSFAAPARQMESVTVPGSAGSGIHPKPHSAWSFEMPIRSIEDK